MAQLLGISGKTFRRAFRRELDSAYALVKSEIVTKVVTAARSGDLKAAMFWLECHGWIRSERLVVADGGMDDSADLTQLTDQQLEDRIAFLKRRSKGK